MKFPLDGKYSSCEVFQATREDLIRKMIVLPEHIPLQKTLKEVLVYRDQLERNQVNVSELLDYWVDAKIHGLVLVEKFYPKNLEIVIGTCSADTAVKYFRSLLSLAQRIYPEGKAPRAIVEIKPSNFLLDGTSLVYCDFIPPRIYMNDHSKIQLEFYRKPKASKKKELEYRFLTREGAHYYLFLHTVSIRPELLTRFVDCMTTRDDMLSEKLLKSIGSDKFANKVKTFNKFYTSRQRAYAKFINSGDD